MRRPDSFSSRSAATAVLALTALLVVGCTPASSPNPSPSSEAPSASPTPEPITFLPEGSADENLPAFSATMMAVAATDARYQGRAYIDALAAAGFPKSDMQVTNDLTTVGDQADSIQFSVRWAQKCLVGQVGPSTPAPTALVLPLLPGDTCLVGQTRPIDW